MKQEQLLLQHLHYLHTPKNKSDSMPQVKQEQLLLQHTLTTSPNKQRCLCL